MSEVEKNNEVEKNIDDALTLAKLMFAGIINKDFIKEYDADARHKFLIDKYPNFANGYPVILRLMARDLKYNENAFRKFLYKLRDDPGKGMEGFIERQADYAKLLYIEDSKKNRRHWDFKTAGEIWNVEYSQMKKTLKKIEADEKAARNEFEDEKKINLVKRKKELLSFIDKLSINDVDVNNINDITE